MTVPGEHTTLTPRSFASFSSVVFGLGLLAVGFSVVDTAMIAPFGLTYVAAVGIGEAVVMLIVAFFSGFIDIFSARLARAEGKGNSSTVFPELLRAYALTIVLLEVVAVLIALAVWFVIPTIVSDESVAHAARQYAVVRLLGVALIAAHSGAREALKTVGARSSSIVVYTVGLAVNVVLNALFLFAIPGTLGGSPTIALALSTVVSQAAIFALGVASLRNSLKHRAFEPVNNENVKEQLRTMLVRGAGIGVRHLNDYAGGTIPFIMASSLGVTWLAAITVASTIWTVFCRVPQACFGAAFVFFGYSVEKGPSAARAVRASVTRYSALPIAVATVAFLAASPILVMFLSAGQLDMKTGLTMVAAFFIVVVPYFFEGLNGELLSVFEDGGFMSWTSTVSTWFGNIGLAAFGIYVLHSAFWAFALAIVPTICLAVAFTWRLSKLASERLPVHTQQSCE